MREYHQNPLFSAKKKNAIVVFGNVDEWPVAKKQKCRCFPSLFENSFIKAAQETNESRANTYQNKYLLEVLVQYFFLWYINTVLLLF